MTKYTVEVIRHEIVKSIIEIDAESKEDAIDRYCCDGEWIDTDHIDCTYEEVTNIYETLTGE